MKQNSVFKNYLYSLSYNLLILFVPMITMPFLSRRLGDINIGIFNFEQSVVNYFIILGCVGVNIYGQREIAYCGDNIEKRTKTFVELLIVRFVTLSVSLVLFLLLIVRNSEYKQYYMLFVVEIVAAYFDISWFFQGVENFKVQATRNFLVKILGVVCVLAFVKTEADLGLYIVFYGVASLIGNITTWPYTADYLIKIKGKLNPLKHFWPAFSLFLPQMATTIYTQLDKTMVGIISEYAEVAYYGQAEKVVKLALTLVTSFGSIMLSRIAVSYAQNNKDKIVKDITKSFRFLFFISYPAMFGVMAVTYGFVPWFFGEGWLDVIPCMMALCPIIFLIGCSNVIGTQYLLPTKKVKYYTISVTLGMSINLLLNLILIPIWGSSGAALSTVVAEFLVTATQFFFVRKVFRFRIIGYGIKNCIAGLIMGVAVFYFSYTLPPSPKNTIFEIFLGAVIYCVLLLIMHDKFFIENMLSPTIKRINDAIK